MIKNYFSVAWRNMIKNKAFSAINILGLGLGLACSLLIMLWVQDERSVDGFHANGKQLFQVYERQRFDGKAEASYSTQGLMAAELKKKIPEIKYSSGFEWPGINTFQVDDKIGKMNGSFASADFFTMFSYPLLYGTPQTALNTLEGIAISRKMAEYFFGSAEKAIGKTIRIENSDNLPVTAVFENPPVNSSQQFDFLRSWDKFEQENASWIHHWGNTDGMTYVQLREDADPAKVEAKIKSFVDNYKEKTKALVIELGLQPYTQKYLHSNFKSGYLDGGRIEYVRMFSIVAIFILLIACINFMNLATARAAKRAKEVGVRKVIGADRFTLAMQFMGEAMLLTLLAVMVAVVITIVLLPAFNGLTGKELFIPVSKPLFWVALVGLLLVSGFVSGSYPAIFLSSLNPVRVLKGRLSFNRGATFFRKGLVVFQFSLSIIFLVGMVVVYRQMDYIQSRNLGYDRQDLLYMPLEGELSQKYALFKEEALKQPGIESISKIRQAPTVISSHTGDVKWTGIDPNVVVSFVNTAVGYDFIRTMKLQIVEGRDFSKDYADSMSFIVNESAIQKMGYKNPIGKPLWWGKRAGTIIGVVKDFHVASMHQPIEPLIMGLDEKRKWGTILVRTQAGKTKQAIAGLEKVSKELNPNFPFTYLFSDQEFAKLYKSEQVVSKLSNYFAFLAIFISCLGLLGLATFTAEQRTKEIGVRKVLGASVSGIVSMLSKDFLKLVLVAIVIATPVAWYCMHVWLQDYAFRTDMSWWIFALAGAVSICIALFTVSFQAIKAAVTNPVKSLRSE